jgi:hypothetical protein
VRAGWQEALFLVAAFLAASAVFLLSPEGQARVAGHGLGAPPLLILAAATVLGTGSLVLLRRGGFFSPAAGAGLSAALGWASGFAAAAVLADLAAPFGREINVPWPDALAFYPAIAVVAVAALQLVPLALLHLATGRAWVAIGCAAAVEPALQVALAPGLPPWQQAFVAAQVLLFGVVGLSLFRRHGIAALLALRLIYALWWHVLWGAARLPLLFGGT